MVRLAGMLACICGVLANTVAVVPTALAAGAEDPKLNDSVRCPNVQSGKPIPFEGHTLIETSDLPPELRLLNALVTANCEDLARQVHDKFLASHPDDYRISFINARLSWMLGNKSRSKAIGDTILSHHPEFSSMLVLMASLALDEKDYERARTMLDRVNHLQPDDLWGYIDQLRLEAELTPSRSIFLRMRAIILDSDFPTGVRQTVYRDARYMQGVTDAEQDSLFAAMMGKSDTGKDCLLAQQAIEIIELRRDARTGARIIEENLRTSGACVATPLVRVLLAEAYLLQAAEIAPRPTDKNAMLVREAGEAMGGDFTELARRAAARPGLLDPIVPFLKGAVDSRSESDEESAICVAVHAYNPLLVKEELDNGANPNGECVFHYSLVRTLLFTATNQHVPERQAILRSLLERGARVESIEFCSKRENGDCSQTLLPILQEFESRRAATRATL